MTIDEEDLPEWPCLNEADGLECEYPFCECESLHYADYLKELPELFDEGDVIFEADFDEEYEDN